MLQPANPRHNQPTTNHVSASLWASVLGTMTPNTNANGTWESAASAPNTKWTHAIIIHGGTSFAPRNRKSYSNCHTSVRQDGRAMVESRVHAVWGFVFDTNHTQSTNNLMNLWGISNQLPLNSNCVLHQRTTTQKLHIYMGLPSRRFMASDSMPQKVQE